MSLQLPNSPHSPALPHLSYGRQSIEPQDIDAVIAVLQGNWLTQGPAVEQFEQAVAKYCGSPYAVAVSSGTAALHLSCLAMDIGPGDWVWTVPNTFVASANAARYCGAQVDFVDINPETYNLCLNALQHKLEIASQKGLLPKALIVVHFSGRPCDMKAIQARVAPYGVRIIEDAAHALGARYASQKTTADLSEAQAEKQADGQVGSGDYASCTTLSFHPVKHITTGEGGMVLTRDSTLYQRLLALRSHGITRSAPKSNDARAYSATGISGEPSAPWLYYQHELGFNYRMCDIQAALGTSQMLRLPAFVQRRQELAARYETLLRPLLAEYPLLKQIPLPSLPTSPEGTGESSWHLYVIQLEASVRQQVYQAFHQQNIGVQVHYIPVHTQPYYQKLGFDWGQFPVSEQYYRQALTLPLHPAMTEADQDRVIQVLRDCLSQLIQSPQSSLRI